MKENEEECVSGINVQCLYAHFNFVNFSFALPLFLTLTQRWCWLDGAREIKKSTLDPSCLSLLLCVQFLSVIFYIFLFCNVYMYVPSISAAQRRQKSQTKWFFSCGTLVNMYKIITIISSNKLLFYYYCSLSLVSNKKRERRTRTEEFLLNRHLDFT